ncbi:helix-turn-helix domain-containing protein [Pseudophaeobacter sp. TrK17]|uniref:helix-turn-helix domain-containing protein n=1 Tax=Pseudophaeobacter sp. TrK17 TaxID=2815167 RepID=UPI0035CED4F1
MQVNPSRATGHRPASEPTVAILGIVRGYYHLQVGEMVGPCCARRLAWPRQIAMALVRQNANCSLPEIGLRFGWRDHTTVMHALRAVADRRKADRQVAAEFVEIERRVELALGQSYVRREHIWGKPFASVRNGRGTNVGFD